jgi:hypothetical protein
MRRGAILLAAVLVACAACAGEDGGGGGTTAERSLAVRDVESSVGGNTVLLPVDVEGVDIVAADGDTSGDSGHFHVFVDREPADVGETIPRERGVVHSPDNPVWVVGLEPGSHELTVVVGDGTHHRIHGDLEDSVTVDVEGPSVWASAAVEGPDVTVDLESQGVDIAAADGSTSKDSGHYHLIVDPQYPPKAGEQIAGAEEGKVYHSASDEVTIEGLPRGDHVIWVVLGDGTHEAFDPPVMDKLTVTIE